MKRISIDPRPLWKATLAMQGHPLAFNNKLRPWEEDRFVAFSSKQKRHLFASVSRIHRALLQIARAHSNTETLHRAGKNFCDVANLSHVKNRPPLLARYDFLPTADGAFWLLDVNSEIPDYLPEATYIEDRWRHEVFPELTHATGAVKLLSEHFKALSRKFGTLYFCADSASVHQNALPLFLSKVSFEAGAQTKLIRRRDIVWRRNTVPLTKDGDAIRCIHIAQGWEDHVRYPKLIDAYQNGLYIMEPPSAFLIGSKAALVELHHHYPKVPCILPAHYGNSLPKQGMWVSKPFHGSRSEGVRILSGGARKSVGRDKVVQKFVEPMRWSPQGHFPLVCVLTVLGEPCGILIRECRSRISDASEDVIPHLVGASF